jgi:hypothetical protein
VLAQQRALGVRGDQAGAAHEAVPGGQRPGGRLVGAQQEPARRVGEGGEVGGPGREERALAQP